MAGYEQHFAVGLSPTSQLLVPPPIAAAATAVPAAGPAPVEDEEAVEWAEWWTAIRPLETAVVVVRLSYRAFRGAGAPGPAAAGTSSGAGEPEAAESTAWTEPAEPAVSDLRLEPPVSLNDADKESERELPVRLDSFLTPGTLASEDSSWTEPAGSAGRRTAPDLGGLYGGFAADRAGHSGPALGAGGLLGWVPQRGESPFRTRLRGPPQARAVVDNYEQALDRITRKSCAAAGAAVLLVWCFDESESMKRDQRLIRDRIDSVYAESNAPGPAGEDALTTAVTSFGSGFPCRRRNRSPTCRPSAGHRCRARRSFGRGDDVQCRVAVDRGLPALRRHGGPADGFAPGDRRIRKPPGERAVPGSRPLPRPGGSLQGLRPGTRGGLRTPAQVRWAHPQTQQVHWLEVDRGPETAFTEQLQSEGSEARTDAYPSGFGPYEQSRLAWATGGIFSCCPARTTTWCTWAIGGWTWRRCAATSRISARGSKSWRT